MISGFWQTDPRLLPKVQKFGCALLDSIYITPVSFEPSDVNEMYKALLQVGFIDEDCKILDWISELNSISARFHFKTKAAIDYICKANERELLKWHLSNIDEDHFTVGNGASLTVWDSMNRPDIMAKYATFVEKVIVAVG